MKKKKKIKIPVELIFCCQQEKNNSTCFCTNLTYVCVFIYLFLTKKYHWQVCWCRYRFEIEIDLFTVLASFLLYIYLSKYFLYNKIFEQVYNFYFALNFCCCCYWLYIQNARIDLKKRIRKRRESKIEI